MTDLEDKITALEIEILGYGAELKDATTKKEKSELRALISTRSETLNRLLDERKGSFVGDSSVCHLFSFLVF